MAIYLIHSHKYYSVIIKPSVLPRIHAQYNEVYIKSLSVLHMKSDKEYFQYKNVDKELWIALHIYYLIWGVDMFKHPGM